MKFALLLFFFSFAFQTPSYSQTQYIEVNSSILKETRQIKLQLPRNYESGKKKYPVVIVLDGDYLFEPFAGDIDYLSYWEIIPESIVVGINQAGFREQDGNIDPGSELPSTTGEDFFDFIAYEVLSYIEDNFRTAPFTIIGGLDDMANFSSFYLLKEKSLFNGFMSLSPDISPKLPERLKRKLNKIDQKIWYYLATSEHDIPELKTKAKTLDSYLSDCDNPNLKYTYRVFENADHFSFVAHAIPRALLFIFSTYGPISELEYETDFLTAKSPSNTLEDKYLLIQELYTIEVPIRIVDFLKTAEAIEELEVWEDYQHLSKLARKATSGTVLHNYFQGLYFEKIGDPKRAIKEYQSAYGLKNAGHLNSDVLLSKADELKRIYGN
ncbi:esterase family protein [Psychroflexus sp. CAK1W]|uniref:alpha/beta hydrolase n=1 Tax=Psychroflexus curvus TaxID=2873595 RepID=UPI001CCF3DFE|nr:alpha/beta hydrolase-fold protein [Psychroflexus curvus]MBZ9627281.1 esterase family protein [Psychroflexus curvus]